MLGFVVSHPCDGSHGWGAGAFCGKGKDEEEIPQGLKPRTLAVAAPEFFPSVSKGLSPILSGDGLGAVGATLCGCGDFA
jgi:hypothetical protein